MIIVIAKEINSYIIEESKLERFQKKKNLDVLK